MSLADTGTSPASGPAADSPGRDAERAVVRRRIIFIAAFLAIASLMPLVADSYWQRVLIFTFVNITLASSWNVIGGIAGYPSFGHVAFFGIGAYTAAILMIRAEMPLVVGVIGGGVVAGLFALLFIPLFRLRGFYFALSTLAAALVIDNLVRNWWFTRGLRSWDLGWSFPDVGGLTFFYFVILGLLGLNLLSVVVLLRSRVGYALHAIHKDEVVAESVGIPTMRYKVIAFVFSAVWPGIMGAVYGPFLVFISPDNVFDLHITLNMILITIFGGIGTLVGPVIGGLVLSVIDQVAWGNFLEYHHLIYGVLIVLIIRFLPGGLVSLAEKLRKRSK